MLYSIILKDQDSNYQEVLENIEVKRGQIITSQGQQDQIKSLKVKNLLEETFINLFETYPEIFNRSNSFKLFINDKKEVKSIADHQYIFQELINNRIIKAL